LKEIDVSRIVPELKRLCIEINCCASQDLVAKIQESRLQEESQLAREILDLMMQNIDLAAQEQLPMCQDTGVAVVFIELGQDVHLVGGDLSEAINEGIRQGYTAGYLRKSMVAEPLFERINTGDNTPAIIHTEIVPGERIKITLTAKGAGAENMSELRMLKTADGMIGVKDFIVDVVRRAGGNPCPPIIVGVGIGGNFEQCALLAKKALLRPLNEKNPDLRLAAIEAEVLNRINKLGIGPQGLGGRTTALAVHILSRPCHIAALPVAVNLDCYVHRHATVVIE
jgi:fumarate hydratase subunit alpha